MIRTYECRVEVSKSGHEKLSQISGMSAGLYNAGLEYPRMAGRIGESQGIAFVRPKTVYGSVN